MHTGFLVAFFPLLLDAGFCFAGETQVAIPTTRTAKSKNIRLVEQPLKATTRTCKLQHNQHRVRWCMLMVVQTLEWVPGNADCAIQYPLAERKSFVAHVVLKYEKVYHSMNCMFLSESYHW